MSNEEFIELLNIYSVNSIIRCDIAEHAKKLVAVAEAAKSQTCSSCRGKNVQLLLALKDLERE